MTMRENIVASAQVSFAYRKLTPSDTPKLACTVGKTSILKTERRTVGGVGWSMNSRAIWKLGDEQIFG